MLKEVLKVEIKQMQVKIIIHIKSLFKVIMKLLENYTENLVFFFLLLTDFKKHLYEITCI